MHSKIIRSGRKFSRRTVLKELAATSTAALPLPALGQAKGLRFGYGSPQTGPLAAFGETDNHVLAGIRAVLKDGIESGGDLAGSCSLSVESWCARPHYQLRRQNLRPPPAML